MLACFPKNQSSSSAFCQFSGMCICKMSSSSFTVLNEITVPFGIVSEIASGYMYSIEISVSPSDKISPLISSGNFSVKK